VNSSYTDPDASDCTCIGDKQLNVLRDLMASGMGQLEASRLLWGDDADQVKVGVRASLLSWFPWLRLPPWSEATP
jgi:hypothetical protein